MHFFLVGEEYLFMRYQFCQDIFFEFGSSEANINPSLASWIEIYLFSSSWLCKHGGCWKFVRCVQIMGKAVPESRLCTNRIKFMNTFEYAVVARQNISTTLFL